MECRTVGVKVNIRGGDLIVFNSGDIWRCEYVNPLGRLEDGQWLKPVDNGKGYMRVNSAAIGQHRVHRLVAMAFLQDYSERMTVDHINGDKSDNRSCNLRMMTHGQNMKSHQNKRKGTTSKYRGVSKKGNMWIVQVNTNGKIMRFGSFKDEELAAKAYNVAAIGLGFSKEALNKLD